MNTPILVILALHFAGTVCTFNVPANCMGILVSVFDIMSVIMACYYHKCFCQRSLNILVTQYWVWAFWHWSLDFFPDDPALLPVFNTALGVVATWVFRHRRKQRLLLTSKENAPDVTRKLHQKPMHIPSSSWSCGTLAWVGNWRTPGDFHFTPLFSNSSLKDCCEGIENPVD